MKSEFKGRVILAGKIRGRAVVSLKGFNTLASYAKSAVMHSKKARCSDQDNPYLYKKIISGKVLCVPQTIGSTTGGLAIQSVASLGLHPAAFLFSETIDSLAASGVILADIWNANRIVTIDQLGEKFLNTVKDDDIVEISENGTVVIL